MVFKPGSCGYRQGKDNVGKLDGLIPAIVNTYSVKFCQPVIDVLRGATRGRQGVLLPNGDKPVPVGVLVPFDGVATRPLRSRSFQATGRTTHIHQCNGVLTGFRIWEKTRWKQAEI